MRIGAQPMRMRAKWAADVAISRACEAATQVDSLVAILGVDAAVQWSASDVVDVGVQVDLVVSDEAFKSCDVAVQVSH